MSSKPNKAFSRYDGHTKRAFVLLSLGKIYDNKNNNIRKAQSVQTNMYEYMAGPIGTWE